MLLGSTLIIEGLRRRDESTGPGKGGRRGKEMTYKPQKSNRQNMPGTSSEAKVTVRHIPARM